MLALAAACTGGVTTSLPPKPSAAGAALPSRYVAIAGETMEFRATLRGLLVGRVQVVVGKLGWIDDPIAHARHRSVIVRSRGKSDGLVAVLASLTWELTTTLDLDAARSVRSVEDGEVRVAGEKPEHEHRERSYGDREQDLHGAAAVLRGWHSKLGDRAELTVMIGRLGLDVELWDAGRERVFGPDRSIAAVRYEGVVEDDYHFVLWLSDDAARVPLRLRTESKWGDIAVELVGYEAPLD